jgi:putative membrane protein
VCCQIFGDIGLVTFSLAPKTTEDLPQELAYFVNMEARKYGINSCMVVNAHNSINGFVNHKETMESLKAAASLCLRETTSTSKKPFKVGASTIMPKNFGLKDGMGPGGITSIVVEVDSQKFAYVIIDGNNLISGLREKILSSLCELGFSEGEVLTTDTHSVNALTLTPRGYNPVGEVIPHDILVNHIKEAIKEAIAKMEIVQVGYKRIVIPKVKVIGKEPLEKLCMLPDETTKLAKRIIAPIFATAIAFLMLFMLTLM